MVKIIRSATNMQKIDSIEELHTLNSGTMLINSTGDLYMAVYVYAPIRDKSFDHGLFPMRVKTGEIEHNDCYPLYVIKSGEKVTLEQE